MRDNVLKPRQTRVRNIPVREKARAVEIKQGEAGIVEYQMRDPDGKPLDLTQYGFSDPVPPAETSSSSGSVSESSETSEGSSMSAAEAEAPELRLLVGEFVKGAAGDVVEAAGEVVVAATGTVRIPVPATVTTCSGIYAAELAIICDDVVSNTNDFYIHVLRGLRNAGGRRQGPPTASEIRLHLRDSAPEESYLLDHLSWDAAEIAEAAASCVDYWNETLPPVKTYTTQNFPYRLHWIHGVISILYRMAAEWYHRNDLQYQAASVDVADMRKWQFYAQKGDQMWQDYQKWVKGQKVRVNIEGGFGGIGSRYASGRYN